MVKTAHALRRKNTAPVIAERSSACSVG